MRSLLSGRDPNAATADQLPASDMISAMTTGIYEALEDRYTELIPGYWICLGNKCEFGHYQSLTIWSKCEDISSIVNKTCSSRSECDNSSYHHTLEPYVDLSLSITSNNKSTSIFNTLSNIINKFIDFGLNSSVFVVSNQNGPVYFMADVRSSLRCLLWNLHMVAVCKMKIVSKLARSRTDAMQRVKN